MRKALSLKPSNAHTNHAANEPVTKTVPEFGGKLTRQIGTSNLRRDVLPAAETDNSPIIKTDVKENFVVYEDSNPEKEEIQKEESSDNNIIHELERKMEEKSQAEEQAKSNTEDSQRFLLTRKNIEIMSVCSEPPSEAVSISGQFDDDECDKVSVASSTFTTIRASFSSIHFDGRAKENEQKEGATKTKQERDECMFTSEEYFSDIFRYMSSRQMKTRPSHRYMDRQADVNVEMRTILIDWFHDVVTEYRLQKETFHLAVSIVDRVMAFLSVDKVQFQLVGTTSLMIAAKYEEIYPPEIEEFAIITDNTYRVVDILKMERYLLSALDFVIMSPTAAWFGACFSKRLQYSPRMNRSLNYLLDISLLDIGFLRYKPACIAAAAICFTNVQSEKEAWPQKIEEDTGITREDFGKCLKDLHRLYICASSSDNRSIFNKYSERDQEEVALIPAPSDKLRELFPSVFGEKVRVKQ